MQAARLHDPGHLEIAQVLDPACPQDGVLVRVQACGLCAADAKMVSKGHPALCYPRIPGHEIAGEILESTRQEYPPGHKVQVAPGLRCGTCAYCLRGDDHHCLQREIFGFSRDGGFAEYIAVPLGGPLQGTVHLLPPEVPPELATLAEPLACCLNAQAKLKIAPSDNVLIMGAGPLGILHGLAAKHAAARSVGLCDPSEERRQTAARLGLGRVLHPVDPDFARMIRSWTEGRGIDVLILACPEAAPEEPILELMARGGRISLFSGPSSAWARQEISMTFVHYMELELSGAYGCRARDNQRAIQLLSIQPATFSRLISARASFASLAQDLERIGHRQGLKTVLSLA